MRHGEDLLDFEFRAQALLNNSRGLHALAPQEVPGDKIAEQLKLLTDYPYPFVPPHYDRFNPEVVDLFAAHLQKRGEIRNSLVRFRIYQVLREILAVVRKLHGLEHYIATYYEKVWHGMGYHRSGTRPRLAKAYDQYLLAQEDHRYFPYLCHFFATNPVSEKCIYSPPSEEDQKRYDLARSMVEAEDNFFRSKDEEVKREAKEALTRYEMDKVLFGEWVQELAKREAELLNLVQEVRKAEVAKEKHEEIHQDRLLEQKKREAAEDAAWEEARWQERVAAWNDERERNYFWGYRAAPPFPVDFRRCR